MADATKCRAHMPYNAELPNESVLWTADEKHLSYFFFPLSTLTSRLHKESQIIDFFPGLVPVDVVFCKHTRQ
jgi:hypothetical protein